VCIPVPGTSPVILVLAESGVPIGRVTPMPAATGTGGNATGNATRPGAGNATGRGNVTPGGTPPTGGTVPPGNGTGGAGNATGPTPATRPGDTGNGTGSTGNRTGGGGNESTDGSRIPGPGAFLLVVALGAVALALRRRG
jgi:hypothetical protein